MDALEWQSSYPVPQLFQDQESLSYTLTTYTNGLDFLLRLLATETLGSPLILEKHSQKSSVFNKTYPLHSIHKWMGYLNKRTNGLNNIYAQ